MNGIIVGGLDFETYCDLSLPDVGIKRYIEHPSFRVLLAAVVSHTPLKGLSATGDDRVLVDFIHSVQEHEEKLEQRDQDPKWKLEAALSYVLGSKSFAASPKIAAHNAPFERMVLEKLGLGEFNQYLIDSASMSRSAGGSSKLEYAARQFTNHEKLEVGAELIKLFSIPNEKVGPEWPAKGILSKDQELHEGWLRFGEYCIQDAFVGMKIAHHINSNYLTYEYEHHLELITYDMNQTGWPIDKPLIERMNERFKANLDMTLTEFSVSCDAELNLNSPIQLQKWCLERGVRAKSFNTESVDNLLPKLQKKLDSMTPTDKRFFDYQEVLAMLRAKQELGGTALKKLDVILDTEHEGRLYSQYMHVGAGQTLRTTGVGVQMQNLKRLGKNMIDDMDVVMGEDEWFSNDVLGENLRQVFQAEGEHDKLFVGDFSSVESRGLAWLAGANWKLQAFRDGKDMYKIAAKGIYNVDYDSVTKDQRQVGKVAELSCGYGGGPNAVDRFATIYGVEFSEEERIKLVRDWRETNPEVVELWGMIDTLLHTTVATGETTFQTIGNGMQLRFDEAPTPQSLQDIHPGARSVEMTLFDGTAGNKVLTRIFHGCYTRGRNVNIYKPGETKNGPVWSSSFVDRNTKQRRFYDIYGGKIAGILTQSMCRELFFNSLRAMYNKNKSGDYGKNWKIIGQFHDEIVVEWAPPTAPRDLTLNEMKYFMENTMSEVPEGFEGFPLEADVNFARRYIK